MLFALNMVDNAQAAMVVARNRRLILGNTAAPQHAAKHDYDLGNRALEKSMPSSVGCTTGKTCICAMRKLPVVPVCRREARLLRRANHGHLLAHPASAWRGVCAIVTKREAGMRWTCWCRPTSDADTDGEVVWSWPPDAEAKFVGLRSARAMGANKPGPQGEHEGHR